MKSRMPQVETIDILSPSGLLPNVPPPKRKVFQAGYANGGLNSWHVMATGADIEEARSKLAVLIEAEAMSVVVRCNATSKMTPIQMVMAFREEILHLKFRGEYVESSYVVDDRR